MNIKGFYHICLINNWQTVVNEQIQKIVNSGLYNKSSIIYIGCCGGSIADKNSLILMIAPFPKFNIIYFNTDRHVYEIPTLQHLQNTCNILKFSPKEIKRHKLMDKLHNIQQFELILEDFLLWYIHTKGITSGNHACRYGLEEAVITQHDKCIRILEKNKNIACCGPSLRHWGDAVSATNYNPPYNGWHFSGNFWWAKASYMTNREPLSNVFAASRNNRYVAEAFIGRTPNGKKLMGDVNNYDCLGINKLTRAKMRIDLFAKLTRAKMRKDLFTKLG